jgi:ABC-2 type transport system ATP-binding protein
MVTSPSDELPLHDRETAIDIDHLRVIRGKRPALHDFSVQIARGGVTTATLRRRTS